MRHHTGSLAPIKCTSTSAESDSVAGFDPPLPLRFASDPQILFSSSNVTASTAVLPILLHLRKLLVYDRLTPAYLPLKSVGM